MRCHLAWAQSFVNANGSAAPCCAPIELGNTREFGLGEIYNGRTAQHLRQELATGSSSELTKYCQSCYALKKLENGGINFDVAYTSDLGAETPVYRDRYPAYFANLERVRAAYEAGERLPVGSFPLRLEIQLGENCDIRCIMCWQDHERPIKLSNETLSELEDMLPYVSSVLFTGGEPTIFKAFWRYIEIIKSRCVPWVRLEMLTHGQHIGARLDEFSAIEHVSFAVNVDGPTPESYAHIRRGSDWKKMTRSLAAIRDMKRGRPNWQLSTTFLLMRANIDLLEESIDFADRYEAAWNCGLVAGDATPAAQSPVFWRENIFRFSHLDYSIEQIIEKLEAAKPRAARSFAPAIAVGQLQATIEQLAQTQQIKVSTEDAERIAAIPDAFDVGRAIGTLIALEEQKLAVLQDPAAAQRDTVVDVGLTTAAENPVQLAESHLLNGRSDIALQVMNAWVPQLEQRNNVSELDRAVAYHILGQCHQNLGALDAAVTSFTTARDAANEAQGRFSLLCSTIEMRLGHTQRALGNADAALQAFERAHEACAQLFRNQDMSSHLGQSCYEYGIALQQAGDHTKAAKPLGRAFRIFSRLSGPNTLLSHGAARQEAISVAAIEQLEKAYQRSARQGEAHNPHIAHQYGVFANMNGDPNSAIVALSEAEKIFVEAEDHARHDAAQAALDLGIAYSGAAQFKSGRKALRRAYIGFLDLYDNDPKSSFLAIAARELGKAFARDGLHSQAVTLFVRAEDIYINRYGRIDGNVLYTVFDRVLSQSVLGQHDAALERLEQAQAEMAQAGETQSVLGQLAEQYRVRLTVEKAEYEKEAHLRHEESSVFTKGWKKAWRTIRFGRGPKMV